jgi:hypothetical protein
MSDTSTPDVQPEEPSNVKPLRVVKADKPTPPPGPKINVAEQKRALKEALAKAREPLTEREGKQKDADKALLTHDREVEVITKARIKEVAAADKAYAKTVAEKDKARKALVKAAEAAKFSADKAREQFAKGEAKINERIAALSPPKA